MTNRKPAIHIIPYIDWPLEGFRSFEQSRVHLVHLLDGLLPDLKTWPDRAAVVLGGQTRLVDNYLEVRPDRFDELREAVRTGRVGVGPWYVEPDVFLVSGEALIRNLLAGQHASERLGKWLNVGVLFESSGAGAQLPQILNGFGIFTAVVNRGVGTDLSELWWEGSDGSGVALFQLASSIRPDEVASTQADLRRTMRSTRDSADELSSLDPLLVFGGGRESVLTGEALLGLLGVADKTSGLRIEITSLEEALTQAAGYAGDWPAIAGELRSLGLVPVWTGAASGRMWVKQQNAAIQQLLERWAEPFSTWLGIVDDTHNTSTADHLRHAWRILLENHNPAAIRGTVIDSVAREVSTRFRRAEQIGREVADSTLRRLAASIDSRLLPIDGPYLPLVVFNATDMWRTDQISIDLELPDEYRIFEVVDDGGNHVSFEGLVSEDARPDDRRVRVRFIAHDVPPFGYRTYAIRPFQYLDDKGFDDTPGHSIENEWLSVTFDVHQGTFSLFDKRSGRSFSDLNRFVDGGDRGDLHTYCAPDRDTIIDFAANTPLHVDRVIGPVTQSLHILQIFRLPERLTDARDARLPLAAQFVPMSIATTIQISQHVPRVDVTIQIANGALDHRLRVHFPTGIGTQSALFGSHFEVIEREITVPGYDDTTLWAEQPTADFPFQEFVTLIGDETGITVASRDLMEAGVIADGTSGCELAFSLLRSVGWLCRDDLPNRSVHPGPPTAAPEAQTTGSFEYRYCLIPHNTDLERAWQFARASLTPLRAVVSEPGSGSLPLSTSLIAVDNPAFAVSAIKQAEDRNGIIVRGYNLSGNSQQVHMLVGLPFIGVRIVRLDESEIDIAPPAVDEQGRIVCQVAGHQILTLRLNT